MGIEHSRLLLEKILDPVSRCLTRQGARKLVKLRADPQLQERLDVLATKCDEGRLSDSEKAEYESYVRAIQFVTVMQSRARRLLRERPGK